MQLLAHCRARQPRDVLTCLLGRRCRSCSHRQHNQQSPALRAPALHFRCHCINPWSQSAFRIGQAALKMNVSRAGTVLLALYRSPWASCSKSSSSRQLTSPAIWLSPPVSATCIPHASNGSVHNAKQMDVQHTQHCPSHQEICCHVSKMSHQAPRYHTWQYYCTLANSHAQL